LIQEGETDAARPFADKALELSPKLARAHFFRAMIQKADGDYDGALHSLAQVEDQYPRDRVVLDQTGRILFLDRRYKEAVRVLEQALAVDSEDLQAHYNLMLCYRGLGQTDKAEREETLFKRFKADEASQQLTARPRQLSPEDNNERQPIHDHAPEPDVPNGLRNGAPAVKRTAGGTARAVHRRDRGSEHPLSAQLR
jgi:tetratricopeptide (TPR) repeat protein